MNSTLAGVDTKTKIMLSDWYKKERARKAAPRLLIWAALSPLVGILCVLAARWSLTVRGDFLNDDQANFMVATLIMIAVPSFVFCGYSLMKLARLAQDSKLSIMAMLTPMDED